MIQRLFCALLAIALTVNAAMAQDTALTDEPVYIQLEARTSLAAAEDSVRQYSGQLDNVNGFSLGGGWYGVALGPYTRADAERVLNDLLATRRIPADSYIELGRAYTQQFYPVGAQPGGPVVPAQAAPAAPAPAAAAAPTPTPQPAAPAVQVAGGPQVQPVLTPDAIPEETAQEARISESRLTREERDALQIALKWAGFYDGGIDGAFGPGTRGSMQRWQTANNFEPTGILTTRQRAELLRQFNGVLEGMGLARVDDTNAGISLELPMGVLAFVRYEAPFAIFRPTTDLAAQVLLISQPGDRTTMNGLYEILQTLEIVPVEGERKRDGQGFIITGRNDRIVTHIEVGQRDGHVKGFALVWPTGDEDRRARVLKRMQDSYRRLDGVLDPALVSEEGQAVDLVSGLQVRRAKDSASGFFVEARGTVLTSYPLVANCERITLNGVHDMRVLAADEALGVAVLSPVDRLAPTRVAQFRSGDVRLQSEVAVAGFSFGGILTAPTLTFGTLEDLRGLGGEERMQRLAMAVLPGDVGGPVFDSGGSVLGLLLPRETEGGRVLPEQVNFAADGGMILDFLRDNGIQPVARNDLAPMAPEDLTALAADMTVLVSCW
ncbi:trypsin-like peptidase domain-containing protein [Maliponia aquimaris]|uniref:Putative peptidoglycan binding domain protein n=1 Tax=Maliponia aquimaris TaxID=1673631 RepID=A0A238L2V3_9RHOB|nr:trypsin-like peptidase domain-containing protein [Maliponia aquimaris]SMX49414.1 Putative peptidoglycan binding domain protein [Maliponia aquimaris]